MHCSLRTLVQPRHCPRQSEAPPSLLLWILNCSTFSVMSGWLISARRVGYDSQVTVLFVLRVVRARSWAASTMARPRSLSTSPGYMMCAPWSSGWRFLRRMLIRRTTLWPPQWVEGWPCAESSNSPLGRLGSAVVADLASDPLGMRWGRTLSPSVWMGLIPCPPPLA